MIPQGIDPTKERTFTKQYKGVVDSYAELGIECSSKTQMNRKQSAINAQNSGVSKESCDRVGHWSNTSRTGAYTNDCIPWEAVRALAGFSPTNLLHTNPRESVIPPEELQLLIFPQLEQSFQQIDDFVIAKNETELAGRSWLRLLKWMRIVILQDAAILMHREDYANHVLLEHDIFQSDLFIDFKRELQEKMESSTPAAVTLLERAMPALGETLSTLTKEIKKIPKEITDLKNDLRNHIDFLKSDIQVYCTVHCMYAVHDVLNSSCIL